VSSVTELGIAPATLVFLRAASALAHMHRRGVLHGDVRPTRIFLSRSGHVKVRGYGVSHVRPPFKAQVKPDPAYAAPETKQGTINEQTDIYNLAAAIYHLVTGRPPMSRSGSDEDRRIARPASVNPKIPGPVSELLMSCLRRQPERRPPDMYEVVKQLEEMVKTLRLTDADLAGITAAASEAEPEAAALEEAEAPAEGDTYEV
jgi:serine/threonine-protein kinase